MKLQDIKNEVFTALGISSTEELHIQYPELTYGETLTRKASWERVYDSVKEMLSKVTPKRPVWETFSEFASDVVAVLHSRTSAPKQNRKVHAGEGFAQYVY